MPPETCGVPPLAHSASRSDAGVVNGQNVTYTCDPGFEETVVDGVEILTIVRVLVSRKGEHFRPGDPC